ncbi:MAG: gliding motility-associated C-terminal domain-containing protein [Bacteroidales bacterium]|nr:gliding motility-associated C-terminal domain-containing protein [Bacteroidales bacterium]
MKRIYTCAKKQVLFLFAALFFWGNTNIWAQPVAKFSASISEGCTPLTVNFTNESTSGDSINYFWSFGAGSPTTSTQTNPSVTYHNPDNYTVVLTVNDTKNGTSAFYSLAITVHQTISANLMIRKSLDGMTINEACANEVVYFTHGPQQPDSVFWDFGDGRTSKDFYPYTLHHQYKTNGNYEVTYTTYNKNCTASTVNPITIAGPVTGFSLSKHEACVNDNITLTINNSTDITSLQWVSGAGDTLNSGNEATFSYSQHGYPILPKLKVWGLGTSCTYIDTVRVFQVVAGFGFAEGTAFCDKRYIYFQNESIGNDQNFWDFGNGRSSTQEMARDTFNTGEYIVTLAVRNNFGCTDTLKTPITIYDNPDIQLGEGWFVCQGGSNTLSASGGDSIAWYPSSFLDDPHSYTPLASPAYSVDYQATVFNKATGCSSTGYIHVEVEERPVWDIMLAPTDDTIIIGDIVIINATANNNFNYRWEPDYQVLQGADSVSLIARPLETTAYTLTVSDKKNCFDTTYSATITIREEFTLGLPEAFTPNNDEINDEIKVDGWGIKSLIEFRIYNRWGTEVYSGNDIDSGWDGTYKGKPQPIDSYAYYIKAETWDNRTLEKKGTFSLIR